MTSRPSLLFLILSSAGAASIPPLAPLRRDVDPGVSTRQKRHPPPCASPDRLPLGRSGFAYVKQTGPPRLKRPC
jgi:hypothetical protein